MDLTLTTEIAANEAVAVLKALSDPNRLRIFAQLMRGDTCNCELVRELKLPANLLSHHLQVLSSAAPVSARRDRHDGRSKLADEFRDVAFDVVITVCDSAAEECPLWLGQGRRLHHSFPDPAKSDDMADFRAVRDAIEQQLVPLLGKR